MDLEEKKPPNVYNKNIQTTKTPTNHSADKEYDGDDVRFNKRRNGTICKREYKKENPFTMKGVERRLFNKKQTAKSSTSNVAKNKMLSNAGQSTTTFQASPEEKKPTLALSCVEKISHNNYEIHVEQFIKNRNIQQGQNSDQKIAKMLIILGPNKHHLIRFELPEKSFTVHDLLKQVEVPFDNDTAIGCVEKHGEIIDFVVTVEPSGDLISKVNDRIKMRQQEESGAAPPAINILHSVTATATTQKILVPSTSSNKNEKNVNKGFLSVCQYCGYCGSNHTLCERCKKVFLEKPKRISIQKAAAVKAKYIPKFVQDRQKQQLAKYYSGKRIAQNIKLSNAGPSSSTYSHSVARSAVQRKSEGDNIKAPEHTIALSSSLKKISHNNYEIKTRQLLINRSIQQVKNSDWKRAKMSVLLPSGEQRLISFKLPRDSCTVQDLLKKVEVPFDDNTTIKCIEKHAAIIDFFVTVGNIQESSRKPISKAEESIPIYPQHLAAVPQATQKITKSCQMDEIAGPSTSAQAIAAENLSNKSSGKIQIKFINGFLAICPFCGFCGHNHSKCERCKKIFIENPKRMLHQKVAPTEAASSIENNQIKADKSESVILTLSSDDERDNEQSHSCTNKGPVKNTVSAADKTFACEPGFSTVDEFTDYPG